MSIDDLFVYGATGKVLGPETRARVGQRIAVLEAENARLKEDSEREREGRRLRDENTKLKAQASPFSHVPMVSTCKRCGRADGLDCVVSDEQWARICGDYSKLCLWCMDELAVQVGVGINDARLFFCGSAIIAESETARLVEETAKLRDLLRRINASTDAVLTMDLWSEIKSAIEPSGNFGEVAEPEPAAVAEAPAEVCAGCNVRPPWEHRCHDRATCGCKECREADAEWKRSKLGEK